MKINKNMKAGYQGKHDSMRAMAEKMLNHPGHANDVYESKSNANKVQIRPYKEGGCVKKCDMKMHDHMKMKHRKEGGSMMKEGGLMMKEEMMESKKDGSMERGEHHMKKGGSMKKKDCRQKFAMGGVGKIRHGEATKDGKLKKMKKMSMKDSL